MSEVLAVVEPTGTDPDVMRLARSVAAVLGAEVRELPHPATDAGALAEVVLEQERREETCAVDVQPVRTPGEPAGR